MKTIGGILALTICLGSSFESHASHFKGLFATTYKVMGTQIRTYMPQSPLDTLAYQISVLKLSESGTLETSEEGLKSAAVEVMSHPNATHDQKRYAAKLIIKHLVSKDTTASKIPHKTWNEILKNL